MVTRKVLSVLLLILTAFSFVGCEKDSNPDSPITDTSTQAITDISDLTSQITTSTTTLHTTPSDSQTTTEQTSDSSDTETSSTSITDSAESDMETDDPQLHGDVPYPTHFNYRFGADGVTVRLSGGNYQALSVDLSASIDHNLDFLYRLEDFNFDGHPDFVVPTHYGTTNVLYAVYIWENDTQKFREQEIRICNPNVQPADQTVCAHIDESASVKSIEIYIWKDNALALSMKYSADYDALTLTTLKMDENAPLSPEIQSFLSITELENAFQAIH